MSGRGRGGRGRGRGRAGRGGRGGPDESSQKDKTTTKARKTLADHVYYVGSARQASDFSVITDFIINHIRQTFEYGNDIANALDSRVTTDFTNLMPVMQQSTETDTATKNRENKQFGMLYEAEIKRFVERKGLYENNLDKAYALIWAQCNKTMQNKIMSRTSYDSNVKGKPIEILQAIEEFSMSYLEHQYDAVIVLDALKNFINTKQKDDENLVDYTRRFKSSRDVLESHVGGKLQFTKMSQSDDDWDKTDTDKQKKCHERAYGRLIALLYLQNSEQIKYGSVLNGLGSQFALKQDQYPKSLTHATSILSDHKFDSTYQESKKKKNKDTKDKEKEKEKNKSKDRDDVETELNFAQLEGACYCCEKKGHRSPQCTKKDKIPKSEWAINKMQEASFIQQASKSVTFEATPPAAAPAPPPTTTPPPFGWMAMNIQMQLLNNEMKNWVLLDTGSTVHIFCNA
jgi:hypothetical protein